LFITLTFPWNVRSETADAKLREGLNLVERTLDTSLSHIHWLRIRRALHRHIAPDMI
jgi:hypothetical protein